MTYSIRTAGGKQGSNIKEVKNKQILVAGDPAYLRNLTYGPFAWSTLFIGFNYIAGNSDSNKTEFQYLATEKHTSDSVVIGGELFIIVKPVRNPVDADDGNNQVISKGESTTVQVQVLVENAEYNWYNLHDSLIYCPFLIMWGIPVMHYQGKQTLLFETEQRYDVNLRWSLVGFAGAGKAFSDSNYVGDDQWHAAGGAGFRYLVARFFRLRMGVDVAVGPDQFAYYIVFGHDWNR